MSSLSDLIAEFINSALESAGGETELRRADIASQFDCVPSQVNYVLTSRFTPELGYLVQSRRGGGGYIRITRVGSGKSLLMHLVNSIGAALDRRSCEHILRNLLDRGVIGKREYRLMAAACLCPALRGEGADGVRAEQLKKMLLTL